MQKVWMRMPRTGPDLIVLPGVCSCVLITPGKLCRCSSFFFGCDRVLCVAGLSNFSN